MPLKFIKVASHPKANIAVILILMSILTSCFHKRSEQKDEQIKMNSTDGSNKKETPSNSVQGNISLSEIATTPNAVILTGLKEHRLVTVYKSKTEENTSSVSFNYSKSWREYDGSESESATHFMPGIDVLFGYNLLNIAHYNLKTEKLNFLFNHATLIKTVYYPSFTQDSIDKKPINRNYYLISVYDEDTNKDSVINRKDLRKIYHFDENCDIKTQLIPSDYSVVRSQYDSQNDVMYIFARQDANKNGTADKQEPLHIFWIDLKEPAKAKLLY